MPPKRRRSDDLAENSAESSRLDAARGASADTLGAGSSRAADWRLRSLVFCSGAVLMGLEIAGSRVLAPHFGNSVFVWGSLITVFLAALSLGNYCGGWLVDRRPDAAVLSGICLAVAVWIGGLSYFAQGICQSLVGAGAGEELGPLVASLLLFLPPSVGMGAVSPFAVRLAASSVANVGKVSGSLYALSTIGSIAGTILTTFVLIPNVGLALILRGLGVVLLVAALAALPSWRGSSPWTGAAMLVVLMFIPLDPPERTGGVRGGERVLVELATPYHNIAVIDDHRVGVRQLRFDRFVEGAIQLEPPHVSVAEYTHYFHLAFLAQPSIERALFIGAGGGIGPRTFLAHRPSIRVDVVDIDQAVLRLAQSHFFLADSDRLRLVASDGRMFVRAATEPYDCIVLDAFTIGGRIPFHLATADFFRLCRERLSDEGVFVMNINSALEGPHSAIFQTLYRTVSSVFDETYVFGHGVPWQGRTESTNILLVATRDSAKMSRGDWRERAAKYQSSSYVNRQVIDGLLENLITDVPDVSSAPILTDDYAPIETMSF